MTESIRDYQAIHLLAEKGKIESNPKFRDDLAKSVAVQCIEQKPAPDSDFVVGVVVYLRQKGHLIPERLDPLSYINAMQYAVDQLCEQAIRVSSQGTPSEER